MQDSLFPDAEPPNPPPQGKPRKRRTAVEPAPPDPVHQALAAALPPNLRLGTSSWYFPGWDGLVWDGEYDQATLSKEGLRAYAQHPLLRTVSLDRAFYRPLTVSQYTAYAAQVPDDFRFVVKAPSLIADASIRGDDGKSLSHNALFLDPDTALREFVRPALEGLGHKLGALVFQLSPLPGLMLATIGQQIAKLDALLAALPDLRLAAPDAVVAVEVRNPEWLTPAFTAALKRHRASYCLGLHAKMPPIAEQLPILRALWPSPLVCRWNLHMKHGAFGYESARDEYAPFNRLVDPDPETRQQLARVIGGTVANGMPAYVTVNNKAEGSAPLSIAALAQALLDLRRSSLSGRGGRSD
ncbi:MAG: DUF72 domain-containing protein [Xanthomonadaceae bacterium]|nr:DUF72 domain-containing protein [Xanthomonadaceae bacterium]